MESAFKYIYKGKEVSKEEFTNVTKEMFKWFENNTINAVDYSSVSDFLDGDYHSKGEINNHLKGVLGGLSHEDVGKELLEKEQKMWNMLNPVLVVNRIDKKAGEKYNKLKAPLDILQTRQFPKALQLLALATSYGNHKYKNTDLDFLNFKRVEGGSQTYLDASARHSTDRNSLDSESGLHHIIHGVWNQLAALELWAEENKINIEEYSKNYLENLQNQK